MNSKKKISAEVIEKVALLLSKIESNELFSIDVMPSVNAINVYTSCQLPAERRKEMAAALGIEKLELQEKSWDKEWLMETGKTVINGVKVAITFYEAERVK
ncbi:MAG: hypothetical protein ACXQS1_05815 [Methermicoccaceae archaeon]